VSESVIRVVAGIFRDAHGRVLLAQRAAGKHLAGLWEFPGGKCEAGEPPEQALRRELHEEIGLELGDVSPLGVVEDVCEWGGRLHHEITFVFDATFADPAAYQRESFFVNETVCDGPAVWVPVERLTSGEIPLYPPELVQVLDRAHGPTLRGVSSSNSQ